MFAEAARRLEQPRDASPFPVEGEAPADPSTPAAIVADLVRVADGAPLSSPTDVAPPATLDGTGQPATFDYTDQLVNDLVLSKVPGAAVTYRWTVGEPMRPVEFTDDTFYVVCAKDPGEFPYGDPAYMPGDHDGCQCDLDTFYAEPDEAAE
jgi:hypothetical protein